MEFQEDKITVCGRKVRVVSYGNLAVVHISGRFYGSIPFTGGKLNIDHPQLQEQIYNHVMYTKYGKGGEPYHVFLCRLKSQN